MKLNETYNMKTVRSQLNDVRVRVLKEKGVPLGNVPQIRWYAFYEHLRTELTKYSVIKLAYQLKQVLTVV